MTHSPELIQKARNIVADKYVQIEMARDKKPDSFATYAAWGNHIDDYSRFMREGAYDDDIAVVAVIEALASAGAA